MIKLTDRQKKTLIDLNQHKAKLEQEYALLQERIKDIVEFIFDANGVDAKDVEQVAIQEDHLVFTKKSQPEPEVQEAEVAEQA